MKGRRGERCDRHTNGGASVGDARVLKVEPGSELDRVLEQLNGLYREIEWRGLRYRLELVRDLDRWAVTDQETFERILHETAGRWSDIGADDRGMRQLARADERERSPVADPDEYQRILDETFGSWSDIDADAMIADIYRWREEGSRPPRRP